MRSDLKYYIEGKYACQKLGRHTWVSDDGLYIYCRDKVLSLSPGSTLPTGLYLWIFPDKVFVEMVKDLEQIKFNSEIDPVSLGTELRLKKVCFPNLHKKSFLELLSLFEASVEKKCHFWEIVSNWPLTEERDRRLQNMFTVACYLREVLRGELLRRINHETDI